MKKLILLLLVLMIAFVLVEREKLFVRDPLANVTRNGVKEAGAQVFINFNNDVLIENDNAPMYVEIIEAGHPVGVPLKLTCMHWVGCLTDAYPATVQEVPGGKEQSMDAKTVVFADGEKGATVVTLR